MSIVVKSGSSANVASVNADGELAVAPTLVSGDAGFVAVLSEVSKATDPGGRVMRSPEVSHDFRTRAGLDRPMFDLSFEGTVISQALVQQNLTSMTVAQSGGFLTLNNGGSTTAAQAANVKTYRTFPLHGSFPTYAEMWLSVINETVSNATIEFGLGFATGVAAPTDGVFFRYNSAGELRGVLCNNSVESQTGVLTSPTTAVSHHWLIVWANEEIQFWIDDVLYAVVPCPAGSAMPTSARELPMFVRVFNNGTPSLAKKVNVGYLSVSLGDADMDMSMSHVMAGLGGGAYQVQPGTTSGQTATYANGAAPAAGTWTASTAPATNTLGGLWLSPTLPAGAETDYPLFAYLNPAGTATLSGKTLFITGVKVSKTVVSTAIGANAMVIQWGLAVGSTASSLATTDAAATVGPRRIALGYQTLAASAAAFSATSEELSLDLSNAPMVAPAGTYVHVIIRVLNNTAAGVLRGAVTILGYFK